MQLSSVRPSPSVRPSLIRPSVSAFYPNPVRDIHELTATVQQLASVAQLVRALHRNRRAVGSIPTRGPCAAFSQLVVPG